MHVRRDDIVEVISGNDAGKKGKILRAIPKKNRIVIEGINVRVKILKKSRQNPKGGRVERECPIQVSNVKLIERSKAQPKEQKAKKKTKKGAS